MHTNFAMRPNAFLNAQSFTPEHTNTYTYTHTPSLYKNIYYMSNHITTQKHSRYTCTPTQVHTHTYIHTYIHNIYIYNIYIYIYTYKQILL